MINANKYFVIFLEFFLRDNAIGYLSVPMSHEFFVDLFGSFGTGNYVRMFGYIVDWGNVFESDLSIGIFVQFLVGEVNDVLASFS